MSHSKLSERVKDEVDNILSNKEKHVDMGSMLITDEMMPEIAAAIAKNRVLELFYLNGNNITANGIESLASAMHDNESIKYFGLDNNKIGDKGLITLSSIFTKNKKMQNLFLSGTGITDIGLEILVTALIGNSSLKNVWLANNPGITEGSFNSLKTLLESSAITHLDLEETSMPAALQSELKKLEHIHISKRAIPTPSSSKSASKTT